PPPPALSPRRGAARVHPTKSALTATPKSTRFGRPVTLTATVKNLNRAGGVPTGYVVFLQNTTRLGMRRLNNGKATLRTSNLLEGQDLIRVQYMGASSFETSTSTVIETIKTPRPIRNVTPSQPNSTSAQPIVLTANLGPVGDGMPTPFEALAPTDGADAE